ncbi:phosphatase PAP2 family protein [Halobellus ruber]|uniref:Phosphatase PAP2 family protein n=1 Tax=Halobellus ruber TaxID=2761102 RepID=A0A7J9SKP4_9EURY|nr:phosphatase PAP2 family protein [Halobellus ruber]MBB6646953.1 phosphatase PAP2 family protein [Halobellus ruber]
MTLPATPLATRGVGEVAFAASLPEAVVALFGLLTHLGNPYLLLACVAVAYLFGDRVGIPRSGAAFALGLGLCAIGLVIGLKQFFGLPRPPISSRAGLGFPSGHALGSTAFWGGFAILAERGRWRRRLAAAAAVIVVVAASRVLIGVHYLVDVVAGVGLGVALLAVTVGLGPGFDVEDAVGPLARPAHGHVAALFALALAVGIAGLAVAPGESELLLGVGTAAGALAGWWRFGHRAVAATVAVSTRSLAVGGGGLAAALAAMGGTAELLGTAVPTVGAGALGVVVLLWLPLAASREGD